MNNAQESGLSEYLFQAAHERLKQLTGLDLAFSHDPVMGAYPPFGDAIARLQISGAEVLYIVEAKRLLTTQNVEMATRQVLQFAADSGLQPLVVATYISSNMGERLRRQEICYVDTAGNAHLRGGPVFVDIQGQRPVEPVDKPRPLGRKGLQLVGLLLAHPNRLNATARELAPAAGVALGTVPGTLRELEARGLLGKKGPKTYAFRDRQRLLEIWVRGYAEAQRPQLLQRRYRLAPGVGFEELAAKLHEAGAHGVLVGGETAAAVYTGYLRPAGATLHLMENQAPMPPGLLLPDARGNVDVLNGFGTTETWQGPVADYVHPLLVYAELLAIGGHDRRLGETAEMLREKYLMDSAGEPDA